MRNPHLRRLLRDPLVLPFYAPSVALYLGFSLLIPVLPLYAEGFGVSYGWIGAVASAQALGTLVADLPAGMVLRRLGQKRAMLMGMAVLVAMVVALFWAGSIVEAFVYRFVSGVGMALFSVARHAYVTEHAAAASRGRVLALFGGLMRVGRFVGPPIGGWIAVRMGLRVPFLISAIVTLPAMVAVTLFLHSGRHVARVARTVPQPGSHGPAVVADGAWRRPGRQARSVLASARTAGVRLWSMLRQQAGVLVPAGFGHIFAQMIRAGRDTIIPLYAANALFLDVDQVGLMLGIAAAVEMVMAAPAGWVIDTLGRKVSLVPSFGIQAVAMALVPFTRGFGGLLACTAAIGMANGLSSGGMLTLGSDLAPPNARGEFLGVWRLIGDLGGTGGPAAVGFVADALALPAAALTLAGAGFAASLVFGLLLPETLVRQQPEPQAESPATSAE